MVKAEDKIVKLQVKLDRGMDKVVIDSVNCIT